MKNHFEKNWTNFNNGTELNSPEVERLISVMPSASQYRLTKTPFYCFIHFGMNTSTGREWGDGNEKAEDFNIKKLDAGQWASAVKAAGAYGIILTCKHHDGFCLWHTGQTDFSVKNSPYENDIVEDVSVACRNAGLKFGIYLSPWDMHEKSYGTPKYNDFFCAQLEELLSNYGEIFEVWFDGAKGSETEGFEYDWQRYYDLVRKLQPMANIAVCGPDIRWVGNEAGMTRKSEFSVVPAFLRSCETVTANSQHCETEAENLMHIDSKSEDLGSREVLKNFSELCWYPAEVDVSIRKGWFWNKKTNSTVKSAKKLFKIYLNSVGNNCTLLLNVPPMEKGKIYRREVRVLRKLGRKIQKITEKPVVVEGFGELGSNEGHIDFEFEGEKRLRYAVIKEDVRFSQRVEKFDIYIKRVNGKYKRVYTGTVIGSQKIVVLKREKCIGAAVVIRQSRSTPVISQIGFYE